MFKRLLIAALAASLLSTSIVEAAVTPNSYVAPQTPNRGIMRFLQGTDSPGVLKTVYTAGANGSRCYGAIATSTDGTTAHAVSLFIVSSTINYPIGTANVPVNSGVVATAPTVSLMSSAIIPGLPIDQYGNAYLQLVSGDIVQATYATALTTSTQVFIYLSCSDF